MLKKEYLVANIGADTTKNEPCKPRRSAADFRRQLSEQADFPCERRAQLRPQLPGGSFRGVRVALADTSLLPRLVLDCIGADLCK